MDYADIILEMLDRIKKLEAEVEKLKQSKSKEEETHSGNIYIPKMSMATPSDFVPQANKRDTTRYMLDGNVYLKNRLVLEVVKKICRGKTSNIERRIKASFFEILARFNWGS